MTATPGQRACIAWNEHYAEEHGIEARNEWAASDPRGRAAWEAAATAGAAGVTAEAATEIVELKAQLTEVLAWFASNGSGHYARVSGTVLAREYKRAGVPLPDDLSHLEDQ